MKTVRSMLYKDILGSVGFVMVGFLALFFFLDFVDDLERFTRAGAGAAAAAWMCVLKLPSHFYELLPIAILIGSIFSLSRMAQNSEFTILRTGGLSPGRALGLLSTLALGFGLVAFVVGDFIAPWADRQAAQVRATATGSAASKGVAWLKDRQSTALGDTHYAVRIERARGGGALEQVVVFEFDPQGRMLTRLQAESAQVQDGGTWLFKDALVTAWASPPTPLTEPLGEQLKPVAANAQPDVPQLDTPQVRQLQVAQLQWRSTLGPQLVAAATLPAWNMSTLELYRYTRHLSSQEQSAQSFEIQFWLKAFYPFACMVMLALALPFAYLHFRSGGVSVKVFGGIMLGISFVLLNNLAGHLGVLKDWTPWLVAGAPAALFLGLSMASFAWLVRNR
ncbi:LptF/LptG family permease [Roseateles sp. BYS180W]|uniref:LptF/LptG family permease n=1 Tax=Roseateles rivi TaxID=3299028 RepID=A0ABW7FY15_9BURK